MPYEPAFARIQARDAAAVRLADFIEAHVPVGGLDPRVSTLLIEYLDAKAALLFEVSTRVDTEEPEVVLRRMVEACTKHGLGEPWTSLVRALLEKLTPARHVPGYTCTEDPESGELLYHRIDEDDDETPDYCAIAGVGCTAPHGSKSRTTLRCSLEHCGQPVCSACSGLDDRGARVCATCVAEAAQRADEVARERRTPKPRRRR